MGLGRTQNCSISSILDWSMPLSATIPKYIILSHFSTYLMREKISHLHSLHTLLPPHSSLNPYTLIDFNKCVRTTLPNSL